MNLAESVNLVQNIKATLTYYKPISNTHLLQTGEESSSVC